MSDIAKRIYEKHNPVAYWEWVKKELGLDK